MVCLLHLHDDFFILIPLAEDIEDETFLALAQTELLRRQISDVLDRSDVLTEEGVEEMDKVLLVLFRPEEALESEVCQQIDVLRFFFCSHSYYFRCVRNFYLPQR